MRSCLLIVCLLAAVPSPVASAADRWYGTVEGWGLMVDPDGDCSFAIAADQVTINVPETPHDLSAELKRINAPRVVQQTNGNFDIEVQIAGNLKPKQPTIETRTAYAGAGLVLLIDDKNYLRLERAALRRGSRTQHYINFEQRRNGRNVRFGKPADFRLNAGDDVQLKLSVRGTTVSGFVRKDDKPWFQLGDKTIEAADAMSVGVAAINATNAPLVAEFQSLRLTRQETHPAEKPKAESIPNEPLRTGYVYLEHKTTGEQLQKMLAPKRIDVELFEAGELEEGDLTKLDLIIVAADTSSVWESAANVDLVKSAGKPVLGIERGGYDLFGKLGLSIGQPHGWHGYETSVRPVEDATFWDHFSTEPNDGRYDLFSKSDHVGIHLPRPLAGVIPIGRESKSNTHYPLIAQTPHYVLWGFNAAPDKMTDVGKTLFSRTCYYTASMDRQAQDGKPAMRALKSSKSPAALKHDKRLSELLVKAFTLSTMSGEDREKLIDEALALFRSRPDDVPASEDTRLALFLGRQLEKSDDQKLTVSTYNRMADVFEDTLDGRVANTFRGSARRVALPGNTMNLTGTTLSGKSFDWESYRGSVVLVDFWASWCGPCRAEVPNILEQYEEYHELGFDVVGVCLDSDADKAKAYVEKAQLPWLSLFEEGAGWKHPMAQQYGISAIPTALLVDRDGKVISLKARGKELKRLLEEQIGPPAERADAAKNSNTSEDSQEATPSEVETEVLQSTEKG